MTEITSDSRATLSVTPPIPAEQLDDINGDDMHAREQELRAGDVEISIDSNEDQKPAQDPTLPQESIDDFMATNPVVLSLRHAVEQRKRLAEELLMKARIATQQALEANQKRIEQEMSAKCAKQTSIQAAEEAKSAIYRAHLAEEQIRQEEAKIEEYIKSWQCGKHSSGASNSHEQQPQPQKKIRLLKPALWPMSTSTMNIPEKRETGFKSMTKDDGEVDSENVRPQGDDDLKYWKRVLSRSQNRYYYFNTKTKETSWVAPTQLQRMGQQHQTLSAHSGADLDGWMHRFSTSKQLFCYYHLERKKAFYCKDPPAKVLHPDRFHLYAPNARSFSIAAATATTMLHPGM